MAEKKNRLILWEVGCEGHVDAWVTAPNWEQATVEAARFWDVPWREVASRCEQKDKIVGAPRNVCCRCKRMYSGMPPMCGACEPVMKTEERRMQLARKRAYQLGNIL